MVRYFQKELPQNVILDGKGRKIPFEVISDSIGITTLNPDDAIEFDRIEALQTMASSRRGGVTEVTEEELLDLKKKSSSTPSKRQPKASVIKSIKPMSPHRPPRNAVPVVEAIKQDDPGLVKPQPDTAPKSSAKSATKSSAKSAKSAKSATKPSKEESISAIETDAAPWDDSPESPRTAQVKD